MSMIKARFDLFYTFEKNVIAQKTGRKDCPKRLINSITPTPLRTRRNVYKGYLLRSQNINAIKFHK